MCAATSCAPFLLAIANTPLDKDVRQNAAHIYHAMTLAKQQGARLVHFAEGALSGYVKSQIRAWEDVDWRILDAELDDVCDLAAKLGIYVVLGCNHAATTTERPHNNLFIISDEGAITARYDKRYLSDTEVTDWYAPGSAARVFEVDGWKFGCAICIETRFPEVFMEYERLDVDCVLVSSYSRVAMDWIQLQGHAACNNLWISLATPQQCHPDLPGGLIGPDGYRVEQVGTGHVMTLPLDPTVPAFDIPLNKARRWRRLARDGAIYNRPA